MPTDAIGRLSRPLRRFLRKRGATDAEVDRAVDAENLALLVLDREIMPGARRYTMHELARRGGTDIETARAVWRAIGFPDMPDDRPAFRDTDVAALRAFLRTFANPWIEDWSLDRALRQARVLGASLARSADAVTDEIAASFETAFARGVSDPQLAEGLAEVVGFDDVARLVAHVFRLQMRASLWRRLAGASPDLPGTVAGSVGFVDLVGYTALVNELDPDEVAALVSRFGELTHDRVVAGGGRVVKTIGDEVMFIADSVEAAAHIAVDLTVHSLRDDLLPATRAGIATGTMVSRDGDYYGPVVNLASRLTEMARPGTVLASAEIGQALADDEHFTMRRIAGRKVRDIGRVDVFRLDPARPPRDRSVTSKP